MVLIIAKRLRVRKVTFIRLSVSQDKCKGHFVSKCNCRSFRVNLDNCRRCRGITRIAAADAGLVRLTAELVRILAETLGLVRINKYDPAFNPGRITRASSSHGSWKSL